jgi:hypothetical protein
VQPKQKKAPDQLKQKKPPQKIELLNLARANIINLNPQKSIQTN